jgi:hypothetical protein
MDDRRERPEWPRLSGLFGSTAGTLAAFAAAYAVLVVIGLVMKIQLHGWAIFWPAVGLLMFSLRVAPRSLWPTSIHIRPRR